MQPKYSLFDYVRVVTQTEEETIVRSGTITGVLWRSDSEQWWYQVTYDKLDDSPHLPMPYNMMEPQDEMTLIRRAKFRRFTPKQKTSSPWKLTNEAAFELGVSPRRLRNLRQSGLFKIGKHYRVISKPGAGRQEYSWHVERCGEALAIPPERRSPS